MNNQLPQSIKSCLWSYDTDRLDILLNKDIIIPQVLNYGSWDAVQWLRKVYGDKEIKSKVQNPRRGIWSADVLNFWEQMFKIKIDPEVRRRAILNVNPDFNYQLPVSGI
jgi:hypothetical protein